MQQYQQVPSEPVALFEGCIGNCTRSNDATVFLLIIGIIILFKVRR